MANDEVLKTHKEKPNDVGRPCGTSKVALNYACTSILYNYRGSTNGHTPFIALISNLSKFYRI